MEWELSEVTFASDNSVSFEVEMTHLDYRAAAEAVIDDEEQRWDLTRILVLFFADAITEDEMLVQTSDLASEYLLDELEKNPKEVTLTSTIQLVYSEKEETWTVEKVPEVFKACTDCFMNVDPMMYLSDEDIRSNMLEVGFDMVTEGEIDYYSYAFLYSAYGEKVQESVDSLLNDLDTSGWFDDATQDFADSYKVGTQTIVFFFALLQMHPGVEFTCEFYKDDPTNIFETETAIMTDMPEEALIIFDADIPEGLTQGTYGITIRLTDGSVFLEDAIEVK